MFGMGRKKDKPQARADPSPERGSISGGSTKPVWVGPRRPAGIPPPPAHVAAEIQEDASPQRRPTSADVGQYQRDQLPQHGSLIPGLPSRPYNPATSRSNTTANRPSSANRPQSARPPTATSPLPSRQPRRPATAGIRTPVNSRPTSAASPNAHQGLQMVHQQSVTLIDGLYGKGAAVDRFKLQQSRPQKNGMADLLEPKAVAKILDTPQWLFELGVPEGPQELIKEALREVQKLRGVVEASQQEVQRSRAQAISHNRDVATWMNQPGHLKLGEDEKLSSVICMLHNAHQHTHEEMVRLSDMLDQERHTIAALHKTMAEQKGAAHAAEARQRELDAANRDLAALRKEHREAEGRVSELQLLLSRLLQERHLHGALQPQDGALLRRCLSPKQHPAIEAALLGPPRVPSSPGQSDLAASPMASPFSAAPMVGTKGPMPTLPKATGPRRASAPLPNTGTPPLVTSVSAVSAPPIAPSPPPISPRKDERRAWAMVVKGLKKNRTRARIAGGVGGLADGTAGLTFAKRRRVKGNVSPRGTTNHKRGRRLNSRVELGLLALSLTQLKVADVWEDEEGERFYSPNGSFTSGHGSFTSRRGSTTAKQAPPEPKVPPFAPPFELKFTKGVPTPPKYPSAPPPRTAYPLEISPASPNSSAPPVLHGPGGPLSPIRIQRPPLGGPKVVKFDPTGPGSGWTHQSAKVDMQQQGSSNLITRLLWRPKTLGHTSGLQVDPSKPRLRVDPPSDPTSGPPKASPSTMRTIAKSLGLIGRRSSGAPDTPPRTSASASATPPDQTPGDSPTNPEDNPSTSKPAPTSRPVPAFKPPGAASSQSPERTPAPVRSADRHGTHAPVRRHSPEVRRRRDYSPEPRDYSPEGRRPHRHSQRTYSDRPGHFYSPDRTSRRAISPDRRRRHSPERIPSRRSTAFHSAPPRSHERDRSSPGKQRVGRSTSPESLRSSRDGADLRPGHKSRRDGSHVSFAEKDEITELPMSRASPVEEEEEEEVVFKERPGASTAAAVVGGGAFAAAASVAAVAAVRSEPASQQLMATAVPPTSAVKLAAEVAQVEAAASEPPLTGDGKLVAQVDTKGSHVVQYGSAPPTSEAAPLRRSMHEITNPLYSSVDSWRSASEEPLRSSMQLSGGVMPAVEEDEGAPQMEHELLQEVERCRREHGQNSVEAAAAMTCLGDKLMEEGQALDAEQMYRMALGATRQRFGMESAASAAAMGKLAHALEAKQNLPDAEAMLRQAVWIMGERRGAGDPETQRLRVVLVKVLQRQNRMAEAHAVWAQAMTSETTESQSEEGRSGGSKGGDDYPSFLLEGLSRQGSQASGGSRDGAQAASASAPPAPGFSPGKAPRDLGTIVAAQMVQSAPPRQAAGDVEAVEQHQNQQRSAAPQNQQQVPTGQAASAVAALIAGAGRQDSGSEAGSEGGMREAARVQPAAGRGDAPTSYSNPLADHRDDDGSLGDFGPSGDEDSIEFDEDTEEAAATLRLRAAPLAPRAADEAAPGGAAAAAAAVAAARRQMLRAQPFGSPLITPNSLAAPAPGSEALAARAAPEVDTPPQDGEANPSAAVSSGVADDSSSSTPLPIESRSLPPAALQPPAAQLHSSPPHEDHEQHPFSSARSTPGGHLTPDDDDYSPTSLPSVPDHHDLAAAFGGLMLPSDTHHGSPSDGWVPPSLPGSLMSSTLGETPRSFPGTPSSTPPQLLSSSPRDLPHFPAPNTSLRPPALPSSPPDYPSGPHTNPSTSGSTEVAPDAPPGEKYPADANWAPPVAFGRLFPGELNISAESESPPASPPSHPTPRHSPLDAIPVDTLTHSDPDHPGPTTPAAAVPPASPHNTFLSREDYHDLPQEAPSYIMTESTVPTLPEADPPLHPTSPRMPSAAHGPSYYATSISAAPDPLTADSSTGSVVPPPPSDAPTLDPPAAVSTTPPDPALISQPRSDSQGSSAAARSPTGFGSPFPTPAATPTAPRIAPHPFGTPSPDASPVQTPTSTIPPINPFGSPFPIRAPTPSPPHSPPHPSVPSSSASSPDVHLPMPPAPRSFAPLPTIVSSEALSAMSPPASPQVRLLTPINAHDDIHPDGALRTSSASSQSRPPSESVRILDPVSSADDVHFEPPPSPPPASTPPHPIAPPPSHPPASTPPHAIIPPPSPLAPPVSSPSSSAASTPRPARQFRTFQTRSSLDIDITASPVDFRRPGSRSSRSSAQSSTTPRRVPRGIPPSVASTSSARDSTGQPDQPPVPSPAAPAPSPSQVPLEKSPPYRPTLAISPLQGIDSADAPSSGASTPASSQSRTPGAATSSTPTTRPTTVAEGGMGSSAPPALLSTAEDGSPSPSQPSPRSGGLFRAGSMGRALLPKPGSGKKLLERLRSSRK